MGAPKENNGLETTTQLSKTHLHPFKSSPISPFPNTHIKARVVTFQALCLLLAPFFQLNINFFTDLGISLEMPNHLKISHHNLMDILQLVKYDPRAYLPPMEETSYGMATKRRKVLTWSNATT